MSNTTTVIKNAGIIAKASAMALADNLKFIKSIDKADESDFNGKNDFKSGDTIYVNKPARFVPNTAFDATGSLLDFTESTVALTLDTIKSVPVSLNSSELATDINIKQIVKRIVKPAVADIAMHLENTMLSKALKATYLQVGTAGSTVYDSTTILGAGDKMAQLLCPQDDDNYLLLDTKATSNAVIQRNGNFQDASQIAKQYKSGVIGIADGFTWMKNQLLPTLTTGTQTVGGLTVTSTVSTQGSTTLTLTDSGGGSQTIKAGTRIKIANTQKVHPVTKTVYAGDLQEFVVTADATAASGAFTLTVSPAMYTTGSQQNIDAFPQSSAAVTFLNGSASTSYQMGLAYNKNAFRFASVPLELPTAVEFAAQETYEGVTVAIVRGFDVYKRTMVTRMDVLAGLAAVRPEWACAVTA